MVSFTHTDFEDGITTTDGTQSTAATWYVHAHCTMNVHIFVVARDFSTGDSKIWMLVAAVKRDAADASVVGSLTNLIAPFGDLGALTWAATLDVDGPNVRIRVTGQSSKTIGWSGYFSGVNIEE